MSFADILPMLSFFQTRSVKQTTTFRGPIEIGDTVKINVYGYVKVGVQAYHISFFLESYHCVQHYTRILDFAHSNKVFI